MKKIQGDSRLLPILLVNFIGTLGFSIVLPFLVVLVIDLGGNEVIYGILGATYSFFQLIGAPILGKWSDQAGRRKILIVSQAGTFLSWVIFLVALLLPNDELLSVKSHPWLGTFILTVPLVILFIARALDGITGGNISVANAYLSDISTDRNRKRNFGKMSAAANAGFIVGPAIAGVLGSTILGNILPVIVAMIISLVAIFVIYFRLFDYKPDTEEAEEEKEKMSFKAAIRLKNVPFIITLYFLIYLAFNIFYVAFPVHSVQTMGWDMFKVGMFFTLLSGVMVIVQGPVLNYISRFFSEIPLIIAGNFILAVCFYLMTIQNDWILYVGAVLFSIGNGIMWPSFLSILSEIAGKRYQGVVQGYGSSAGSLASIIGLITGGFLYARFEADVFLISVVIFTVIGIIAVFFKKL